MEMRTRIIRDTADIYRPDLFIVDKEPTGLRGEVVPALDAAEGARHAAGAGPARRHGRSGSARRRMGAQERRAGAARPLRRDLDLRPAADQQAADRHRGAAVGAPQDGLYRLSASRPAAAQRHPARDGGDRRALHPGHRGRRRRRRRPDRLGAGGLRERSAYPLRRGDRVRPVHVGRPSARPSRSAPPGSATSARSPSPTISAR